MVTFSVGGLTIMSMMVWIVFMCVELVLSTAVKFCLYLESVAMTDNLDS